MQTQSQTIHYIPPVARTAIRLRVAAYARVSSDSSDQLESYAAQVKHYDQLIRQNPQWELVDIYADEGLTDTSTKKRDEFNKMMKLCRQGKIDLILTKSISRFARNTLDSLEHVRKLKTMGIGVFFERENINTLHMSNEMVFTMLAAFAQAESESISENVRWGKRQSMKQGKIPFQYKRLLGYEKGEDGKPVIVPEQAETVKWIFASFLAGQSIALIKKNLEAQGILSPSGKPEWSQSVIRYVLSNEKYIGDALLQKTYVVDCISKQVRKNMGEIAQHYVENNHPAIIPHGTFRHVQEELARRNAKRRVSGKALTEKGKYALSELLVCGECGTRYRRVTWARGGKKKIVWRCISRLENGTQHCKESPTLEEIRLHDAILRAINEMLGMRAEVLEAMGQTLETVTNAGVSSFDRLGAQQKVAELEAFAAEILGLSKDNSMAGDFFEGKLTELYGKRTFLLDAIKEDDARRANTGATSARLQGLMASLRNAPEQLGEYGDAFIREHVESVRVIDSDTLLVVFKGGIEVETEVRG